MQSSLKLKWKNTTLVASRKAGQGAYGVVYECYDANYTDKKYAVKRVNPSSGSNGLNTDQFASSEINKEYDIMRGLNHRAVIRVHDLVLTKQCTYIIMEMCETDLSKLIPKRLTQKEIYNIMIDLTSGLRYMQAINVIHRDLKPENILMKAGGVRITDFGVSKKDGVLSTNVGTPVYQAPEVGQHDRTYDGRCDSFSLGIILYEMCYLKKPFRISGFNDLYEDKNRLKTKALDLPAEPQIEQVFKDIILGTIVFDPDRRMTISDIYYHLKDSKLGSSGSLGSSNELETVPKGGIRIKNMISTKVP